MDKFHISEDGNPRPCTAEVCPLGGGEADHIVSDSKDEVRAFAEKVNMARYEAFSTLSKDKSAGFGSEDQRAEVLGSAVSFYNSIWEHPEAGSSEPTEDFENFYEGHRAEYRDRIADGFDVSPKNVYLEENLAIVQKDGKFLVLDGVGMYSEGNLRAKGSERSAEEIDSEIEDGEYADFSGKEVARLKDFMAANRHPAGSSL